MQTLIKTILVSTLFWGCSQPSSNTAIKELSANEFKVELDKNTPKQLVDVRTDGEVLNGVIAHARQIDLTRADFEQQLEQLNKTIPVFVYCASGIRSKQAAQVLAQKGFRQINNLEGGVQSWIRAGNPLNPLNN